MKTILKRVFVGIVSLALVVAFTPSFFQSLSNSGSTSNPNFFKVGKYYISGNHLRYSLMLNKDRYGDLNLQSEAGYQYIMQNEIGNLITKYVSVSLADDLNINIDDSIVRKIISSNENLQDNGNFSKDKFTEYSSRYFGSQDKYFNWFKGDIKSQYISNNLYIHNDNSENSALKAISIANNAIINIDYIELSEKDVESKEPTSEDLQATYDKNKDSLRIKESREASIVVVDKSKLPITSHNNVDLQKFYSKNINSYMSQEKIAVSQKTFESKTEAYKAYEDIQDSQNQIKLTGFTDIPLIEKSKMAVQIKKHIPVSAKKGSVIKPFETDLGWYVLYIKDMKPSAPLPFNQVKEDVKRSYISYQQAQSSIKAKESISSSLQSGDINKLKSLAYTKYIKVNSSSDEMPYKLQSLNSNVNPKMLSDKITKMNDNGYIDYEEGNKLVFVKLNKINPSYIPSIEDTKDEIQELYKASHTKEALGTLQSTMIAKAQEKGNLKGLGKGSVNKNIQLQANSGQQNPFQENGSLEKLVSSNVFNINNNKAKILAGSTGKKYYIVQIKSISTNKKSIQVPDYNISQVLISDTYKYLTNMFKVKDLTKSPNSM